MNEKIIESKFGSPDHPLKIGNREIPCYVLADGTRVLAQSGMIRSLGMARGSSRKGGDRLANFITQRAINPFISAKIRAAITSPIKFKSPSGIIYGYEATILPDICEAVLTARENEKLQIQQAHIAKQCEILVRGLAVIGIIALVDEATGYQEVRDREALQKILEKYITDEWARWTKTFPDEYYRHLFRLKNMSYPPRTKSKPSYIGHWTNDIVYKRLAPGVLKTLKEVNPKSSSGNRARKLHQHLTRDYGHPELKKHLDNIIFLMKGCINWGDFERRLNRASPRFGDTMPLELPIKEEEKN